MKTKLYSKLIIALFAMLCAISCDNENTTSEPQVLSGALTEQSECKDNLKSTTLSESTPDSLSCVQYSYNKEDKTLSLTHINAGFNCCPGTIKMSASLSGDTIVVTEKESTSLCDCNCLYDLEMTISNVESKSYYIQFVEDYARDQQEIFFEVDFSQYQDGDYCVVRTKYPWGQ